MRERAPLKETPAGLVPQGDGWFVVNAREARWYEGAFGPYTRFEGDVSFPALGINLSLLHPGVASCMYHGEDEQEDFLVLAGECLLLIEGEEVPLKAWDFFHCPAWVEHVFVGAGEGPCLLLSVGTRTDGDVIYPESEVAQKHGAGVEQETPSPEVAYQRFERPRETSYREGWLPDVGPPTT